MVAGQGNPLGCVPITDGGAPRIITGVAASNISGGAFVYGSTAAGVVGSQTDSYVTSDIKFITDASGAAFNGVAMFDATSGTNSYVSVLTHGTIIALSDGTTTAAYPVICAGANAVRNAVGTGSLADTRIGRAITSAGSEAFCIVDIQG